MKKKLLSVLLALGMVSGIVVSPVSMENVRAEESVEKLFAGFSQVDTSSNRMEGGVGLGLAISQALVKKMGGAITVRSKLGKGSIVKFVEPQKVLDEAPIASIQQKDNINVK